MSGPELINEIIRLNRRVRDEEENCLSWIKAYSRWYRAPHDNIDEEWARLQNNIKIIDRAIDHWQKQLVDIANSHDKETK